MMLKISSIQKNSLAQKCGFQIGDIIHRINGNEIKDILDYLFCSKEEKLIIDFFRDQKPMKVGIINRKLKSLGLEFSIDNIKRCQNKCIFCFIDQLPKGLRETLYIKDDDTVLSLLSGNYITLTNLSDSDFERIARFRLSPLKISVHTTNSELRCFILKNPKAKDIISQLEFLKRHDIEFDAQIVLMKGINDEDELDRTISDLERFYPNLKSIAVVPVGLTKYREGLFALEPFSSDDAKSVLSKISKWQDIFLNKYQKRLVFASDEFYIKAKKRIPPYRFYEDFRQLENGVGMIALFKKQFISSLRKLKKREDIKRSLTIITGVSAYDFINELLKIFNKKFPNIRVNVLKIINNFFGEYVTVSGLLSGQDIISQAKNKIIGDLALIPSNALNDQNRFIDDISLDDLKKELNVDIYAIENNGRKLLRYLIKGGDST